jgi:hypothetical protein
MKNPLEYAKVDRGRSLGLCWLNEAEISRSRFLGLGLSAALLSSGVSPFVAKAQTVNFGAATSGKLSSYARGDGSDETEQINKCLRENLVVEIDEPPAGVGYGFSIYGSNGGLLLKSGHELYGQGVNSKLLRVGKWQRNGIGLRNSNKMDGNSSIKLNNIYIDGFRGKSDVPDIDSNADSTGIAIRALPFDKWCEELVFTNVEVHNWPGVAIRVRKGSKVTYTDVKSVNPARGGIIFVSSKHIHLLRTKSVGSGDDAIAFYSGTPFASDHQTPYRPTYGITVDRCESGTRMNPQFGAAIKFLGAREALVTNSTFRHAKNSLVCLGTSYEGGLHPVDIRILDCRMLGGMKHSFQIIAGGARLIRAKRNYMYGPRESCVYVRSLKGEARTFDVGVTDNTLVKPGSGKYIYVQENLSGVYTKGNRLLSSDARPTISNVSPGPGSKINDTTPRIKATVKDEVTNLSKSNIRLYVGTKAIPRSSFSYDRTKNLLSYTSPKLSPGRKSVKVVATDAAGNRSAKSWYFTIDTVKPVIEDIRPRPDSHIADSTPTIKATVRDNRTNISMENIRLYVGTKAIPRSSFSYDRTKNLLSYTSPKLSPGRKSVKVVATDAAGNRSAKSWMFTVTSA